MFCELIHIGVQLIEFGQVLINMWAVSQFST